jgi:hypothetical protein
VQQEMGDFYIYNMFLVGGHEMVERGKKNSSKVHFLPK